MDKTKISQAWDWPWRFKLDITRKEQIPNFRSILCQYHWYRMTVPTPISALQHIACFLFFLPKNTTHLHYRECIWLSFFNHVVLKTEAAETLSSPVNIPWQWASPKTQSQGSSEWGRESGGDGGKGFWMQPKENVSTNNGTGARASAQAGMNWNQNMN